MKKYDYRYKIVSAKELSQKILESEDPVYFLVYVKSSTDKFIAIYNSENGDILYSNWKGASYNVKSSDFKDISKTIRSQSK
jgi:hypothetical protein